MIPLMLGRWWLEDIEDKQQGISCKKLVIYSCKQKANTCFNIHCFDSSSDKGSHEAQCLILCIILHLAPIRADRADCNIVSRDAMNTCSSQVGTLQSSTGTVLCITLPPTGRNFIISGCISSPLIWDQGLGVVSPGQPIRGQYLLH